MRYLPHIVCLRGDNVLVILSATADFLTGLAYFTIPFIIVQAERRGELSVDRWLKPIWLALAAFIFFCGAGHWMDVANLWLAKYELRVFIGWGTAFFSWKAVRIFHVHWDKCQRLLSYRTEILERLDRIEAMWPAKAEATD